MPNYLAEDDATAKKNFSRLTICLRHIELVSPAIPCAKANISISHYLYRHAQSSIHHAKEYR